MQFCGEPIPQNRIFAQYHKDYPNTMKQLIVSELVKERSNLRLVLATVALGMDLNAPYIQRIIHCRPPTTMEKYMQEIGRAGRNGLEAEAIMFFNMSDVSKSRKGFTTAMREFCLLDNKCYRKELLNYFGFNNMMYNGDKRKCCSYCKSTCILCS
jgi:ATP-dependent DNA helicase RecQ